MLEKQSLCNKCNQREKYGVREWCKPCILSWQRESEEHAKEKNTITDYCRIEDVIPGHYRNVDIEKMPEAIRVIFEKLPEHKGLMLWGSPGVGKTHWLCAIARKLFYDGWDVARINYEMLTMKIRDCYARSVPEYNVLEHFLEIDKLILEDVGTTKSLDKQESDFSLKTFFIIINHRIEHCKATYISSNKSVEELGRSFDARIESRLQYACEIIELKGRDRRIKQ